MWLVTIYSLWLFTCPSSFDVCKTNRPLMLSQTLNIAGDDSQTRLLWLELDFPLILTRAEPSVDLWLSAKPTVSELHYECACMLILTASLHESEWSDKVSLKATIEVSLKRGWNLVIKNNGRLSEYTIMILYKHIRSDILIINHARQVNYRLIMEPFSQTQLLGLSLRPPSPAPHQMLAS